jgi:hypothetical protein
VNALEKADFVSSPATLTQTTDDRRCAASASSEFPRQSAELKVPTVSFFAGEHDASLDRGEAYQEVIGGPLRYTFDHKGVHFIVLVQHGGPLRPCLGARTRATGCKPISRGARTDGADRGAHAPGPPPPAVCFIRNGLGDAATGRRPVDALLGHVSQRDGVRRPHPPRATTSAPGTSSTTPRTALMFPLSPPGRPPQNDPLAEARARCLPSTGASSGKHFSSTSSRVIGFS